MRPIQDRDVLRSTGLGRVWSTARFLCGGYRIRLDERGWHWMTSEVPSNARRADVFVSTAIRSTLARQRTSLSVIDDAERKTPIVPDESPESRR
ncbi:hypothetical protein [Rhodoplanes sp. SY1]|uniref:hypothetical protein n=1 Tax=Rhodoplanes sp. SY1 TaxID=3166646 RepID=UPI0038B467EB